MAKSNILPPKLQAVIVRLGRDANLNVTKAVKLPYIVDVIANRVLGHPITEGTHQAWEKGAVTSEAWRYLDKAKISAALHLKKAPYSEERTLVVSDDADDSALTDEEKEVVDAVREEFGPMMATEVGQMTKLMNPTVARWGSNRRASIAQDAFDAMSPQYQNMVGNALRMTLEDLHRDSVSLDGYEGPLA